MAESAVNTLTESAVLGSLGFRYWRATILFALLLVPYRLWVRPRRAGLVR
jgi:hypothetical protein